MNTTGSLLKMQLDQIHLEGGRESSQNTDIKRIGSPLGLYKPASLSGCAANVGQLKHDFKHLQCDANLGMRQD